jgi:hypothetical protein
MKESFYGLCICLIVIHEFVQYGQTQLIRDGSWDPLSMDEAYLTISNKNDSDTVIFKYNAEICENCAYEHLNDTFRTNTTLKYIIDTKYLYDFKLLKQSVNEIFICQINSYQFYEHGSYLFEVTQNAKKEVSCSITQANNPSYYWIPFVIGMAALLIIILFIQLWHHISQSQRFARFLPNASQQGLINNDYVISLPKNRMTESTLPCESTDDIINTLRTGSELPLVGSTRLSNNSIRITKVLPQRLRALDTFRGFSLMVMILVNYGGKYF